MSSSPYTLFVIPILLETDSLHLVSRVLVVDCDERTQRERLTERAMAPETVDAILSQQASRKARLAVADDILCNDKEVSRTQLEQQVSALHSNYIRAASTS